MYARGPTVATSNSDCALASVRRHKCKSIYSTILGRGFPTWYDNKRPSQSKTALHTTSPVPYAPRVYALLPPACPQHPSPSTRITLHSTTIPALCFSSRSPLVSCPLFCPRDPTASTRILPRIPTSLFFTFRYALGQRLILDPLFYPQDLDSPYALLHAQLQFF